MLWEQEHCQAMLDRSPARCPRRVPSPLVERAPRNGKIVVSQRYQFRHCLIGGQAQERQALWHLVTVQSIGEGLALRDETGAFYMAEDLARH